MFIFRLDFVPLDEGVLKNWLNQFDQGLVDVYRKSQALPEEWNEKPVKILVNDNFESVCYFSCFIILEIAFKFGKSIQAQFDGAVFYEITLSFWNKKLYYLK